MNVETWCSEHGISKANFYCLKRVRKHVCQRFCNPALSFIELFQSSEAMSSAKTCDYKPVAILRDSRGLTLEFYNHASADIIRSLQEVLAHVKWCNRLKKDLSCSGMYGPEQRHRRFGNADTVLLSI